MKRRKAEAASHRIIRDAIAMHGRGSAGHHAAIVRAAAEYRRIIGG